MQHNRPSRTAYRVAMRRAAHQIIDSPVVFEDPLSLPILGPERALSMRQDAAREERGPAAPYLRAFLAVRSRFAEETLDRCVKAGVRQYVILGAGLDTFAYRNPHRAAGLHVFEVDHPSTQAWKRELLDGAGLPVPDSVTFVPVDFERQSFADQLQGVGFRKGTGAFFSWLGVTPYLRLEAVRNALHSIADLAGTSGGVVFDYSIPPSRLGYLQRLAFRRMASRVEAAGEPWITFFNPEELAADLHSMGFRDVEDLAGEEINRRYFDDRTDGLRVGGAGHIVKALVSPSGLPLRPE